MIAMRPIREYDVIDLLNKGRFEGEVEGYVVMDGPKYLGHMLYRVDGAVTQVLECGVEEKMFVDGAVRACVAAGENAGDGGLHILIDHRAVGAGIDLDAHPAGELVFRDQAQLESQQE